MTIGTGYAYMGRTPDEAIVGVMSDSRLSWRDGRHAEIAIKALDLGPRMAVVSAGTALVGPFAAELTRSIIDTTLAKAERPVGLWDATRTFAHYAREIQRYYRDGAQHIDEPVVNEFVIVGFYENGAPGLASLLISRDHDRAEFWRPVRQHLAFANVGDSTVKDIVTEAYMQAGVEMSSRFNDWHHSVASAFWYAIQAGGETFASVGGGISAGLCTMKHSRMVWPQVEVDGQRFFRGLPLRTPTLDGDQPKSLLRLEVDTEYAVKLDRIVEEAKHKGGRPTTRPNFACSIDELVGASPFRRVPEPRELCFMYM